MITSKDRFTKIYFFLIFITSISPLFLYSQQIKIEPDPAVLDINQDLVISLTIPFQKKARIGNFPEIADFSKKQTIYQREDSLIKVYQHYRPRKSGSFHLPPFSILIDEQIVNHKQTTIIKVSSAQTRDSLSSTVISDRDEEFVADNIEARLVTEVSSHEIYPGETISLQVYLHIQRTGDSEFNFINISEQLNKLKKALIPDNSLSEVIDFGSVTTDTLSENGSFTTRYLLLNALIAPTGTSDIKLRQTSFSLLSYARRKSAGLIEREDVILTVNSSPLTINIIDRTITGTELTPGTFYLSEKISTEQTEVNRSVVYEFLIHSNVNSLFNSPPTIRKDNDLAKVLSIHKHKRINNGHSYSFYIVPYRSGSIELRNLIYWPYFNTSTHQPDTLWPSKKIVVSGDDQNETSTYKNDPFYKKIDKESNKLRSLQADNMLKLFINLVILFMFAVTVILIIRK